MTILSEAIALADLEEEAQAAALIVSRCHASGMDARSYRCAIGAAVILGICPWSRGARWPKDTVFVNALIDLECDLYTKLQQLNAMIARLAAELAYELEKDRPNKKLIAELQAALEVLRPARVKVQAALARVMAAPDELEEVYAACYAHVRSGRVLPFNGRFMSGEVTA